MREWSTVVRYGGPCLLGQQVLDKGGGRLCAVSSMFLPGGASSIIPATP